MSRQMDLGEVVAKVKSALARVSATSGLLAELMIVSELWFEDSKVHIVAWVPDVDPKSRRMIYTRKRIVYDLESGRVEIRNEPE